MTCEHHFVPFPGSNARLYCERCGDGVDAFTKKAPVTRAPSEKRPRLPRQEPLPGIAAQPDPDAARAREILSALDARGASFAERIDAIMDAAGIDEETAARYRAEALAAGPEVIELDGFAALMNEVGEAARKNGRAERAQELV